AHRGSLCGLLAFRLALRRRCGCRLPRHGGGLAGRAAGQAARHPLAMLAAAAVPVMVTEAVFGPDASTGGWERLAYLFPFLYGFLIARAAPFESAPSRVRGPAVALRTPPRAALPGR